MNMVKLSKCRPALIYARVSTDEQADKGYSLSSQLEACRKYAAQHDFAVVAEFSDDFTGSVPIEMRPEGKKAFQMLKSDEADVLIAYTMDRLVRPPEDGDEWDTPVLIRSLARLNKEIHTVNRGQLKTDFASLLIAMLDAKSAGDERRKIIERTSRGRVEKAKDGKVVCAGRPPYGYKFVGEVDGHKERMIRTQLAPDEVEAGWVKHIYELYVYGNGGKPLNLMQITRYLKDSGVKPPYVGRSESGEFGAETLRRILSSETYIGTWRFGKLIGSAGTGGKRGPDEQISVSVPPIIERSLWDAAQRRREFNSQIALRNSHRTYLLSGHIRCLCGRAMSGVAKKISRHVTEGRLYYVCSNRYKFADDIRGCQMNGIHGAVIEAKVMEWVVSLVTDPDELEANLRSAQAEQLAGLEPTRTAIEETDKLVAEAQHDLAENISLMKGLDPDSRRYKKLALDGDEIERRLDRLEMQRHKHEVYIASHTIADNDIADIVVYSRDAQRGLQNPTFEQKRAWLNLLQVRVELTSQNTAVATCLLPVEPHVIDSLTL